MSWLIGKGSDAGRDLGAGGRGDDRGWDGWMASPTRWTWVWVNSRRWWWTERLGVLGFIRLQRVGHDWATELNWTEVNFAYRISKDLNMITFSAGKSVTGHSYKLPDECKLTNFSEKLPPRFRSSASQHFWGGTSLPLFLWWVNCVFAHFLFGESNGNPLHYSCLENSMDGGAWWAIVHGVAKSWTRLSDFTFTFHFHALEKEMATHSTILAWRIPWTEEPVRLPSMRSHRVGHDWCDLAAAAAAIFS